MTRRHDKPSSGRSLRSERGAVAIIFAIVLVLLFGVVGLVIDIGRLLTARTHLANAVDFGSLAGATQLPATGPTQGGLALQTALDQTLMNEANISAAQVTIGFRCIVGDRNGDGQPDIFDIPFVCGSTSGPTWSTGWTCRDVRCQHACDPFAGDKCNTIIVSSSRSVPYIFAPVIGVDQGNTGVVSANACRGRCGGASTPLDVVMVLDRTTSMTNADVANAKLGARTVLQIYDPAQQWVGLVAYTYADATNNCLVDRVQVYPQLPNPISGSPWRITGLDSNYRLSDGSLNPASAIVSRLQIPPPFGTGANCIERTPLGINVTPSGAGHTDIGDPVQAAQFILQNEGRAGVPDVIILLSDGEANQPRFNQPCQYAITRANTAKNLPEPIEIFTLGYGIGGKICGQDTAAYRNARVSRFLQDMSTPPALGVSPPVCNAAENTDGDHFFCEAQGADLQPVFAQIAEAALGHSRLVDLP